MLSSSLISGVLLTSLKLAEAFEQKDLVPVQNNHRNGLLKQEAGQPCFYKFSDGSQLTISYDINLEAIEYVAVIAQNTYLAVGYGTNMVDVDMVSWVANGASSLQQDMYSQTYQQPSVLAVNAYNTTIDSNNATFVQFTTTRPLAATGLDSYVIPLDQEFPIVWAFAETPEVSYHNNNKGTIQITLLSSGGCQFGAVIAPSYPKATLHGVLMWFAWTILALAQIFTGRYLKHYWKNRQLIHSLIGLLSGIITLASIIIVLKWLDWAFYFDHWHNVAGILFMVLCELLVIGGIFAATMKTVVNMDWKTKKLLQLASIHKYFGYFMIFATQLAVITGIMRRIEIGKMDEPKKVGLVIANVILFVGTLLFGEIRHQMRLRTPVPLTGKGQLRSMPRYEFENAIKEGQLLVVLDKLVLDVHDFIGVHPGGKFVIHHNVGSDISKFFFGGYCLEDNLTSKPVGHVHSAYARMIVNDLAIAELDSDLPSTSEVTLFSKSQSSLINPELMSVVLKASFQSEAFKVYYNDDRVLGMHFRVQWAGDLSHTRHYTICNVMRPQIYNAYVEALTNQRPLDLALFNSQPTDELHFTIKDYKQPNGLSSRFFSQDKNQAYLVSGPFGKGLLNEQQGIHIAFAGGTGVLTFMDLVAKVAQKVLFAHETKGIDSGPINRSTVLNSNFVLVLYVSFPNEQQAIGMRLLRGLDDFCRKHNLPDFKLVTRIAGGQRWDQQFIQNELSKYKPNDLKKVWVCGPPPMSETFDKVFEDLIRQNFQGLTQQILQVL